MQLPTTPVPRRKPFLPKESSSKRMAIVAMLIAITAALSAAWFVQMKSEANRRAANSASSQPAGAMSELEAIEKMQLRADAEALDGYGRDSVLRFQGLWQSRSYPITPDQVARVPVSLVVQVEPGTKRSLHPVNVEHPIWQRIAGRLNVSLDRQSSTAFAGTLTRPDGRPRVVFVDLRLVDAPLPAPVKIESRITVCTPPEPGMDFAIARAGEWSPLVEFAGADQPPDAKFAGRDLLAFRAARIQLNGVPLLERATLLLLDSNGAPARFELTIDNADGASLQRLD